MTRMLWLIATSILCLACTPAGQSERNVVILSHLDPGAEAESDTLFSVYGLGAVRHQFTLADLHAMPTVEVQADFPKGAEPSRWHGVHLSHLLDVLGASGDFHVRLTGLDGYQVEAPQALIADQQPILAYKRDGEMLAIGGLGPLILIWPRRTEPELSEMTDDLWPWGVFALEIISDSDV